MAWFLVRKCSVMYRTLEMCKGIYHPLSVNISFYYFYLFVMDVIVFIFVY